MIDETEAPVATSDRLSIRELRQKGFETIEFPPEQVRRQVLAQPAMEEVGYKFLADNNITGEGKVIVVLDPVTRRSSKKKLIYDAHGYPIASLIKVMLPDAHILLKEAKSAQETYHGLNQAVNLAKADVVIMSMAATQIHRSSVEVNEKYRRLFEAAMTSEGTTVRRAREELDGEQHRLNQDLMMRKYLGRAINNATKQGVVVVAASGYPSIGVESFSEHPQVIMTSEIKEGTQTVKNTDGDRVDIYAPSAKVLHYGGGQVVTNNKETESHSFAAPFAAVAAAVASVKHPRQPEKIKKLILDNSKAIQVKDGDKENTIKVINYEEIA